MEINPTTLAAATAGLDIAATLDYLARVAPGEVVFSTSFGQEDQVISHHIFSRQLPIRVFTLDTGRLFPETYEVFGKTLARYRQPIEVFFPDTAAVQAYATERGPNAFYQSVENRQACCHIRKIEPLGRALAGAKIWITGLRAEQSAHRQEMPVFDYDTRFAVTKYNPLLNWTLDEVEAYLDTHRIPQNVLHQRGFVSIGCAPCTRAIEPGEDVRAGRWWWEQSHKECGLHR